MKPIQVGLLGIGTVGSGVFNVLKRNQEEIQRRAGRRIEIAMVADLDTARAEAVVTVTLASPNSCSNGPRLVSTVCTRAMGASRRSWLNQPAWV